MHPALSHTQRGYQGEMKAPTSPPSEPPPQQQQPEQELVLAVQTAQAKAKDDVSMARAHLASGHPVPLKAQGQKLNSNSIRYAPLLIGSSHKGQGLVTLQGGTLDCTQQTMEVSGQLRMEEVKVLSKAGLAAISLQAGSSLHLQGCTIERVGGNGSADIPKNAAMVGTLTLSPGSKLTAQTTLFKGLIKAVAVVNAQASIERCTFDSRDSILGFGPIVAVRHGLLWHGVAVACLHGLCGRLLYTRNALFKKFVFESSKFVQVRFQLGYTYAGKRGQGQGEPDAVRDACKHNASSAGRHGHGEDLL